MSKNFPNDNIYSILGKLDALKPTPEETRFALVKEIRESVEAQGSILSGVDAVQAKLARQFAAEGEVTRTPGKTVHRSTNAYGGTPKEKDPLATLDKAGTNRIEKAMGVKFDHGHRNEVQTDECTGCAMGECSVHGMMENDDDQFSKILDACAAIYRVQYDGGDEIWDKDLYEKAIDDTVVDFADLAEQVMGNINDEADGIS